LGTRASHTIAGASAHALKLQVFAANSMRLNLQARAPISFYPPGVHEAATTVESRADRPTPRESSSAPKRLARQNGLRWFRSLFGHTAIISTGHTEYPYALKDCVQEYS
jgi:sialic acid synthase SpsE